LKNKILFIARNIPTPKQRNNKVILRIAEKLSNQWKVKIVFPNEWVPWGFHFLPKYKTVHNLKPWKANNFDIDIQKYFRLPFNSIAFLFANSNFFSTIPFQDYSLIHAHYIFPDGILAFRFFKKNKTPYIITVRESDLILLRKVNQNSNTWNWTKKVLENAEKILALNKATVDYLKLHFNLDVELLPHGIDSQKIKYQVPVEKKRINISVVSEAIATKQLDWIIESVKNYKGKKEIELHIIGDGVELNNLKQLAQSENNINFYGKIPHEQVFEHLSQSDIFALPSRKESFGLVYLEAAATCNAIIGYRGTGIYGVLEEEKEIIYIDNYDSFQNSLYELIENAELRNKLKEAAFKKVKQYTWENIINRYNSIYQSVIQSQLSK